MNYVYFGTPDFAADILESLLRVNLSPKAVVSMPDKRAGRGRKVRESRVKLVAQQHGITVIQPASLRDNSQSLELVKQHLSLADLGVVVAYGHLIPQAMLDLPIRGCINLHASLLPRWRGAAPIQHAILSGDCQTGISIMQMEKGLDSGAVFCRRHCQIENTDTAEVLQDKLIQIGAEALIDFMLNEQNNHPIAQDERLSTYADKIHKQDARINWQQPIQTIDRTIRAFYPAPIAWSCYKETTLRILRAKVINEDSGQTPAKIINISKLGIDVATTDGCLRISELQLAGRKRTSIAQLLNGRPDFFKLGDSFH